MKFTLNQRRQAYFAVMAVADGSKTVVDILCETGLVNSRKDAIQLMDEMNDTEYYLLESTEAVL